MKNYNKNNKLIFDKTFESKLINTILMNKLQTSYINEVLNTFITNPLDPEFQTTKIYISNIEYLYSSIINKNIKLLWRNMGEKNINLIDISYI
jgi:hypothetical protein